MNRVPRLLSALGRMVQLAVFMLVFAVLFGACLTPFLVQWVYVYDHGHGETERCMIWSAVIGAVVGAVLYEINRKYDG